MDTHKFAFDVKEAARVLSISPWTVRKMITDGRLPAIRFNRRVLISPEAIRQLIEQGRKKPWAGTQKR